MERTYKKRNSYNKHWIKAKRSKERAEQDQLNNTHVSILYSSNDEGVEHDELNNVPTISSSNDESYDEEMLPGNWIRISHRKC